MKFYQGFLEKKGISVKYVESREIKRSGDIASILDKLGVGEVFFTDLDDDWLSKRLSASLKSHGIAKKVLRSPSFLSSVEYSRDFFESQKTYFQTSFYIAQRKRMGILLDDGGPVGGSWTFDKENRKKLPKSLEVPEFKWPKETEFLAEAKQYVAKHFPNNPGELEGVSYPITHAEAERCLKVFIEKRLRSFGDYQDAISQEKSFLFHSLLSAPLNVGLLTPEQVCKEVLAEHEREAIPLNSLEGFIRQVIGWREYFRAIYDLESVNQRTKNFFGFKRKIPKTFWTAETGIEPIDIVIGRILENAYAHHIERLMVLGNFMLLCEFDPDEVYRWFMELFIDSYDWVMVPNVYGMSQYADGGLITTKPYVSSSNYIRKMSDFKPGPWTEIWDALYWNFIDSQRDHFKGNNRMSLMLKQLDKMDRAKLGQHKKLATQFLNSLDNCN